VKSFVVICAWKTRYGSSLFIGCAVNWNYAQRHEDYCDVCGGKKWRQGVAVTHFAGNTQTLPSEW